jgi:hypothetical protein
MVPFKYKLIRSFIQQKKYKWNRLIIYLLAIDLSQINFALLFVGMTVPYKNTFSLAKQNVPRSQNRYVMQFLLTSRSYKIYKGYYLYGSLVVVWIHS